MFCLGEGIEPGSKWDLDLLGPSGVVRRRGARPPHQPPPPKGRLPTPLEDKLSWSDSSCLGRMRHLWSSSLWNPPFQDESTRYYSHHLPSAPFSFSLTPFLRVLLHGASLGGI